MRPLSAESGPQCPWSKRSSKPSPEVVTGESHSSLGADPELLPTLHAADELLTRVLPSEPLPNHTIDESASLVAVARWAQEFLTNSHPELGRSGAVCPYVRTSLQDRRFLLTLLRDAALHPQQTDEIVLRLAAHFLRLEPQVGRAARFKTIVILFPDLPEQAAPDIINGIHQRLKPQFLQYGLMLGEFFKESSKPGLHNPLFRPLRSDIPLLVIRAMVPTDIAFLSDQAAFVKAYLSTFRGRGCSEVLAYLDREGNSLSEVQRVLLQELVANAEAPAQSSVWPAQP
jgi:hypothetical protein